MSLGRPDQGSVNDPARLLQILTGLYDEIRSQRTVITNLQNTTINVTGAAASSPVPSIRDVLMQLDEDPIEHAPMFPINDIPVPGSTVGGGGQYIVSITTDTKGRVTSISTTSTPPAASFAYSFSGTGMTMSENRSYLILPVNGGLATGAATCLAAPGIGVTTTLAANYTGANTPWTFPLRTAYSRFSCFIDVARLLSSGSGTGTIQFDLYSVVTNPAVAGNYTLEGTTSLATTGSPSFQALGFTNGGAWPVNASAVFVVSRSDSNASLTVTDLEFTATLVYGV